MSAEILLRFNPSQTMRMAHGEIVRFDKDGQPLPVLPPHDQALLDAYHAMSSQEQQMVCRMVGIKHPDEKQKKNKQHA